MEASFDDILSCLLEFMNCDVQSEKW
jgi:hypothetical protein